MAELKLTRMPGDRHMYELEGVGTLRLAGWTSRAATAEAGGLRWRITRRGFWRPVIQAADEAGVVVGEFRGRTLQRGGALQWSGRELALRRDSFWHARYDLIEGDRRLAAVAGGRWGRRRMTVAVEDVSAVAPGLLLFAAFVVRALANDAQATVASA
jgi:hypothetical protein